MGRVGTVFGSLAFRVGAAIVCTEIIVLSLTGSYALYYEFRDMRQNVIERLESVGRLFQDGALSYTSIADRGVMTGLVGEELIEGLVVGANGTVFHSFDPSHLGQSISQVEGIDPAWFDATDAEPILIEGGEGSSGYLVSITPLFAYSSKKPLLFSFLKVSTAELTERVAEYLRTGVLGILGCVIITSLVIFFSFRSLIFRRLGDAIGLVGRVQEGDLEVGLSRPGDDELGILEKGMNSMVDGLRRHREEIQAALAALKRSEDRFRGYAEAASDAFWETDSGLIVTYCTETRKNIGIDAEKLIGQRLDNFLEPQLAAEEDRGVLRDIAARRQFRDLRLRRRLADESIVHLRINGKPHFDEDGAFQGYRGTYEDVTEHVLTEMRATAMDVLDRLPIGVILVDDHSRATIMNRAAKAIIEVGDGLTLGGDGVCRAAVGEETAELHALVRAATDWAGTGDPSPQGVLTLARRTNLLRPYSVLVAPIGGNGFEFETRPVAAAIFITDPERRLETPAGILGKLYGLTGAEARLASELVKGEASLVDIAERLGVSVNTIKTHLKQVYRKTATSGQADLVRLVLRGAAGAALGTVPGEEPDNEAKEGFSARPVPPPGNGEKPRPLG